MITVLAVCVLISINVVTIHCTVPCNTAVLVTTNVTNVTSPNYPSPYPDNLVCWWTFRASDPNNQVVVAMADSSIDFSLNCSKSSLTFYDGSNATSPLLSRYCGTNKVAMASTGNSLFVEFRTGTGNHQRGFRLATIEIPKCGGDLIASSKEFRTLTSPYYPIQYFSNLHCTWRIRAENASETITVDVLDSVIEPSPGCRSDSVRVFDGNTTSATDLGVFCGNNQPTYQSSSNQMMLVFKTDLSLEEKGYKLKYHAVSETTCDLSVEAFENVTNYIVSPGYPHAYYNNLHCTWTIITLAAKVELLVISSDIEGPSPKCDKDSVTVYQDYVNPSSKLGMFCGDNSNSSFYIANTIMMVEFKTNSVVVKRGFKLGYRGFNGMDPTTSVAPPLPCGNKTLTVSQTMVNRFLLSPGYPTGYYGNENCIYTITGPSHTMIHIKVTDSQLEDSVRCEDDYVHVYDGNSVNAKSLTIWCSSQKPEVQSTGNQVTLKFVSDNSVNYRGFNLTYFATTEPYLCTHNLTATTTAQYLTSPNYPKYYQNNANCTWVITTSNHNIRLEVVDSVIEMSLGCASDFVTVVEELQGTKHPLGTFCSVSTPSYTSSGQTVQVQFHSNDLIAFKGFKMQYRSGSFSLCGDHNLTPDYQDKYLESPNYPYNYPSNTDCVWTIYSDDPMFTISVHVKDSSIQYSSGCSKDYVEAFDGPDTTSASLGRFCGTQTPTYYSYGRYLTLHFHSDGATNDKGFKIAYHEFYSGGTFYELDVSAVAGGSVGGVVFLVIVIVIAVVWYRRRRLTGPPLTRFK